LGIGAAVGPRLPAKPIAIVTRTRQKPQARQLADKKS
jgi:hypothetical protein